MDANFAFVLLLALLPGAGNFAGGLIAEFWKPTPRLLNLALHAASGIVIAIVAVELVPEALQSLAGWWIALAFTAGGVTYTIIERVMQRLQAGASRGRTRMWISISLALVLAGRPSTRRRPGGLCRRSRTSGTSRVPRRRRRIASASFVAFPLLAATLAFTVLRGTSESLHVAALLFVAGC